MNENTSRLIHAGTLPGYSAVKDAVGRVDSSVYHQLNAKKWESFGFLSEIPLASALAFFRAIELAEKLRLCPFPGSVSLLIPAFQACHSRPEDEVATIADWIVTNHDNPYTPFNFRQTRTYWEEARQSCSTPIETYRRVREIELDESKAKTTRAKVHEVTEGIARLAKGEAPDSPEVRERILQEMERRILDS